MGGETRQQLRAERRRLEKERRRSQLVIQPLPEAKEKARAPIVSFGDMIGLLAIPLAAASMLIDNMWAIGSCLFLATFIACVSITLHDNSKIMYRFAACIVSAVVFLSLFFVLHFEYDKRELAKNEGVLESVRKVYVAEQSFLTMRRIEARRIKAKAFRVRFSKSFASLRHLPSQAKVRSTTHLRGMTSKPFA